MKQAEDKAAQRTAEVAKAAEADGAALRKTAGTRLDDAAEFIVGRVVKH
jgi:hypothetical protein